MVLQINAPRPPPDAPDGIRRVQVGCGPHHIRPDWWNTDLRPFPGIDEILDATSSWPWQNCLDYVYGEHFLEHLQIDEALRFLVEAGRALRRGGRIRLSTPSLEWVLKTHFAFLQPERPAHLNQALDVNRAFYGWGHRFLHTRGTLRTLLHEVGYSDVRFFDYQQSNTPALVGLELHVSGARVMGYPAQWIVEGERGDSEIKMPEELRERLERDLLQMIRPGH